ncbi:MAG: hypothetical protein NTY09_13215 [bacterium]|nr:hypothetical protein [bacterium]
MRSKGLLYSGLAAIFIILLSAWGPLSKRPSDNFQVPQNIPIKQKNIADIPSESHLISSSESDIPPSDAVPLIFNDFHTQSTNEGNGNIENLFTEFHKGTESEEENTWVRVWGEDGSAFITDLVTDSDGNAYAVGIFMGMASSLSVSEDEERILPTNYVSLTKFDAESEIIWSKKLVVGELAGVTSIEIDIENNLYLAGYYNNASQFNFNNSIVTAGTSGGVDTFLCKIDSECNLLWFKCWGGEYSDGPFSIALENNGDLLVAGYIGTSADQDQIRDAEGNLIISTRQVFLMEFSTSGDFLSDKLLSDADYAMPIDLAIDINGNIYVLGDFSGRADFDPGPGIAESQSVTDYDIFVAKYDYAYNFIWARTWNGPLYEWGSALEVDDSGDIYILGSGGYISSGPPYSDADHGEVFLSKLNPDGDLLTTVTWPNAGFTSFSKLILDKNGNIYWTGSHLFYPTDFDPGSGVTSISPSELMAFVVSLDSSLHFNWVRAWGEGGGPIDCSAIAINDRGGIIVSGSFWGSHYSNGTGIYGEQDFDPGPGVVELPSNGQSSFYITSLNSQGWLD